VGTVTISIMDKFHRHIRRKSRELAMAIHEELDMTTPIDTEHAVSNWIFSLKPRTDVVGSRAQVDYDAGHRSLGVVQGWDPFKGELYLINNVPYIGILNSDSTPSMQAPPEFVEDAIEVAKARTRY